MTDKPDLFPNEDLPERRALKSSRNRDMQDARPLLQAIFLGVVLATVLTAAATLAGPEATARTPGAVAPIVDTQSPEAPSS